MIDKYRDKKFYMFWSRSWIVLHNEQLIRYSFKNYPTWIFPAGKIKHGRWTLMGMWNVLLSCACVNFPPLVESFSCWQLCVCITSVLVIYSFSTKWCVRIWFCRDPLNLYGSDNNKIEATSSVNLGVQANNNSVLLINHINW